MNFSVGTSTLSKAPTVAALKARNLAWYGRVDYQSIAISEVFAVRLDSLQRTPDRSRAAAGSAAAPDASVVTSMPTSSPTSLLQAIDKVEHRDLTARHELRFTIQPAYKPARKPAKESNKNHTLLLFFNN